MSDLDRLALGRRGRTAAHLIMPAVALLALTLAEAPLRAEPDLAPAADFSWRLPDADLYGVATRGRRAWAVGYWGAVLRSLDDGASWTAVETPTRATLFAVDFADEQHGWAVGESGLVLRTTNGGLSWSPQQVEIEDPYLGRTRLATHLFDVTVISPTEAWAVGDMGIAIRTRDGETWEHVPIPESAFADEELPDRILNAVSFPDRDAGWIIGEFATTLRTRDGGATWVGQRRLEDTAPDLYLFDVSAIDAQRAAVVGLAGNVLVTRDGGQTWQPQRAPTSAPLYAIVWSSVRDAGDSELVTVGDRGVIYVRGSAETWAAPERPRLFNWLRDVTSAESGRVYAVGEKGLILVSEDGGQRWSQRHGVEPPPFAGVSVPEAPSDPEGRPPGHRVRVIPELRSGHGTVDPGVSGANQ